MTARATAASLERDGRRDRNANSNGDRSALAEATPALSCEELVRSRAMRRHLAETAAGDWPDLEPMLARLVLS